MHGSGEIDQRQPKRSRFGRYQPGPHLSPFVRNYWTLQATGACRRQRVLPDGCIDLLFVRHSPTEDFRAFVVGARPAHLRGCGSRGVSRHPARGPAVSGISSGCRRASSADRISLECLSASSRLIEAVANAPDGRTRLQAIEEGLGRWLRSAEPEPILATALDTILASRGMVSVARLARLAGWSPRHLQRVFRERVGVGPKMFCRIVRFKDALHALRHRPRPDLLQVALEAGYYDQAHFIHDFDRFYGSSPSTVCRDRGFEPMSVFYNTPRPLLHRAKTFTTS
jgi:AraC-like DNA-binding protein